MCTSWWSLEERQAFLDTIKDKNVQLIIHGHDHQTYIGEIEGIPVVCSGGSQLPVSFFDENGHYEKTIFFDARQESDGSFTPVKVSVSTRDVYNE